MENQKVKKIGVGVDGHSQARFNLSHDVNTTMTWGDCEPLMCELMLPNSKLKVKAENLTRLAPMPSPVFARLNYETHSMFVPMDSIFPGFASMMSGAKQINGTTGAIESVTGVPRIANNKLISAILCGAEGLRIWRSEEKDPTPGTPTIVCDDVSKWNLYTTGSVKNSIVNRLAISGSEIIGQKANDWLGYAHSCISLDYLTGDVAGVTTAKSVYVPVNFTANDVCKDTSITPDNADLVIYSHNSNASSSETEIKGYIFAFCFRLSDYGKRLYKLFRGLGYNIDFGDDKQVSLLPLMAYYRAYYELFGINLYKNFESTALQFLINENRYQSVCYGQSNAVTTDPWFNTGSQYWRFIRDLAEMWHTDSQDFVSSNIVEAYPLKNGATDLTDFMNSGFINVGALDTITNVNDIKYGMAYTDSTSHTAITSELLKIHYKWTNRQCIEGQDIEKRLHDLGQGDYINTMSREPAFIGHTCQPINVSDIASQADTLNSATGDGYELGQFAGKAVAYDNGKVMEWKTDTYGYWITMAEIVPQSGYCQQVDRRNYAVDRFSLYQPDFDGLGLQPTLLSEVVGSPVGSSRGASMDSVSTNLLLSSTTFGYVPRSTEWKFGRNVINGDFALNSTRDSYSTYHLDKLIEIGSTRTGNETAITNGFSRDVFGRFFSKSHFPRAGVCWRFGSRYPWLNNFNRIFSNNGIDNLTYSTTPMLHGDEVSYYGNMFDRTDENFLCHNVLYVTYEAPMKPYELSFGTFDEEKGANSRESHE